MAEVTKTPSGDSNIFAALSYLWILSIIFYVIKKDDEFVKFHAKQGMVLLAVEIVAMFLFFLGPIPVLINLVVFVLMVIGAIKAYQGEKYRIPVVADLADKINF